MISLRYANMGDLDGIMELCRILVPNDLKEFPERQKAVWQTVMENRDIYRYIVAEEDGAIVSTCNITIVPNLTRSSRPFAVIENVVTHPDARRKGLGRRVIEMALDFAKENNCYKVLLLSGSQRIEAHRFYESLGFSGTMKKGFVIEYL